MIPANNFYEWTGQTGKRVPYYIGVEDQDIFAMAGIWEEWSNNGTEIQSAAIIITIGSVTLAISPLIIATIIFWYLANRAG